MTTGEDDQQNIIQLFNDKYGKDLLDLEKCKEIQKQYSDRIKYIESELDLTNENSTIAQLINKIDKNVDLIDENLSKSNSVIADIKNDLDEVDEVRRTIQDYVDNINKLECLLQYLKVIQRIEFLRRFQMGMMKSVRQFFANLCEISRNLMNSNARNLRNHLKETLFHWHTILKEKFARDFEEVIKAIKWPFVNTNFSLQTPSQSNIQRLQIIAEYLLQIQMPEESSSPVITSALLSNFPPLCLPLHYLLVPLKRRFLYHFYGARQTNRIDKPEWYFTQILSWVRDHEDFVTKWIQPIIDRLGMHHIDAKMELMRGLVQLAVEKLYSDIPNLQFDDFVFSHCIDEALGFDRELRETYHYPSTQSSILAVLTQGSVFMKWMKMEHKYATEKMDVMLSPNIYETFQPISTDDDNLKITTCADNFMTLLQTITERYELLPQPGHRLQFLELQLELLDDFRVRLLQLVNAETGNVVESKLPMIANTLYYVENVLVDWGNTLHFLNLFYYKSQLENVESRNVPLLEYDGTPGFEMETETVFADTLSLYRHMRKDILCTLAETVLIEVKTRSKDYRRERWSTIPLNKEMRSMSLTPSACPLFEILGTRLHQLQKNLTGKLFKIVWQFIASQLDTYLFEDLVLDSRFNEGGALQFKFDITRNLYPLFSQFSEKPDNFFTQLNESCNLLTISKGSALLLRETLVALEGATGVEDRRGAALKEVGVVNFTPKMAVTILNQRTDITVQRMTID
ncbi:rad50-interacting protein 1 rint-1 [Holotrichia oblita]|uniref:Rad50-interacting protein 1 rint-1 n=1 Tax=Holotrichia oblita TaxID=644536 RepID=A0ACB9SMA0_HOLOL|nr:rad50-interacting protein 1 rint-1 [Holotrichia oblita]